MLRKIFNLHPGKIFKRSHFSCCCLLLPLPKLSSCEHATIQLFECISTSVLYFQRRFRERKFLFSSGRPALDLHLPGHRRSAVPPTSAPPEAQPEAEGGRRRRRRAAGLAAGLSGKPGGVRGERRINPFLTAKQLFPRFFTFFNAIFKFSRPEHDCYAKFTSCST